MKKLLLVKKSYRFFPIGLAHIITALRKNNVAYELLDMDFQNGNWRKKIEQGDYCAVGMGGLYADFNFIVEFSREVKRISPRTPFILGGNITSDIKKELLFQHTFIDYAVIGEGEKTLPELLHYIDSPGGSIESIQGIVYRGLDGMPITTTRRKPIDLHSENYYPTWDDFKIDFYLSAGYPGYEKFTAMPVLTGRGCIGRCTFCSPTNGRYRMRPIEQVIEELKYLTKTYQFKGFAFLNEVMYPTEKMMLEFLSAYEQTGIGKSWIACLRVDIGVNLLRAMKEAGCVGVNCGIESGNNRVLSLMRKNITVEQVKTFYRNCKEVGLPAQGAIMFGSEGESEEDLKQTIDLIIHEDIHSIGGTFLISYPGTEVYNRAIAQGHIKDEYTYLKNLDFSNILTNGTFRNVHYLNMSAMSDDKLFRVGVNQSCRHLTYNYLKFSAKNIDLYRRIGECAVCGNPVAMSLDTSSMLNCFAHCECCFSPVFFNLYDIVEFKQHASMLRQMLSNKDRIAIYGTGVNARYLHIHNVLWIDLDNILYCVDELGSWKGQFFFNAAVVSLEKLSDLNIDIVLVADTVSATYAETNLKNSGFAADRILSLIPAEFNNYVFDLYSRRYKCA